MPIINKRWDGSRFRAGATFRRWTGSEWKTGATVRTWTGSDWIPSLKLEITGGIKYIHGLYTYHAFHDVGETEIIVKGKGEIQWVIFGGGGSSGRGYWGAPRYYSYTGGGAGTLNVLSSIGYEISPGVYTVTVGAGGLAEGQAGGSSSISNIPTAFASGGGSGSSYNTGIGKGGGSGGGSDMSDKYTPFTNSNKMPVPAGGQTFANLGGKPFTSDAYSWAASGGGAGGAGNYGTNGGHGLVPPGDWRLPSLAPMPIVCMGGMGGYEYNGKLQGFTQAQERPANSGSGGNGGGWPGKSGAVYIRYLTGK